MNIGIVGAGRIVKEVLPIIKDIPGVNVQSILTTGRNPVNTKKLKKKYNINKTYTNDREFLIRDDLDVVYIATPNFLHFYYAKAAIENKKHVICEKPFTLTSQELYKLKKLANKNEVIITEAISTIYLENFIALKNAINHIGKIKIAQFDFSQYSSKYNDFKKGNISPAFNLEMGGGTLMDLNVYNIHLVVGLFGSPKSIQYHANMEKNVDTSGILYLEYNSFKVICIAAKDSNTNNDSFIQGTQATIHIKGPNNALSEFEIKCITGVTKIYNINQYDNRMQSEFNKIFKMIQDRDFALANKQLEHSIKVLKVLENALQSQNIHIGPSVSFKGNE